MVTGLLLCFVLPVLTLPTKSGFAHEPVSSTIKSFTEIIEQEPDSAQLYLHRAELNRIEEEWQAASSDLDKTDKDLEHQNRNPVKLLTSGPEERSDKPIEAGGKIRNERRVLCGTTTRIRSRRRRQ